MQQELENKYKEACEKIEKLERENFGMKRTIQNLKERLERTYYYDWKNRRR